MSDTPREAQGPVLIAQSGAAQGSRWPLSAAETIIGRDFDCQIVIPIAKSPGITPASSARREGYWIEDLGSKNGTHVNGVAVADVFCLQDGDLVQIALAPAPFSLGWTRPVPLERTRRRRMTGGCCAWDRSAHRVWVGGQEVDPPLSPQQFRLLELLYLNPTRIVTRGGGGGSTCGTKAWEAE